MRPTCHVRDVMISDPKTLPTDATLADAQAALSDEHVHMVLLTDGHTLRGTLIRTDLPETPSAEDPAVAYAVLPGRTVAPDAPVDRAHELMMRSGIRRLAVVDSERTLLGLVCIKRSGSGFCSDADVASRAAANSAIQDRTSL